MNTLRIFWHISIGLFMIVLLWSYLYLPMEINFDLGGTELKMNMMRSHFFYAMLGFFALINASISAWAGLIKYLSPGTIPVPRRDFWFADSDRTQLFYTRFNLWLKGLNAFINFFLLFLLLTVYMANDNFLNFNTSPVLFFILLLIFGWLPGYYFIFNRPDEEAE